MKYPTRLTTHDAMIRAARRKVSHCRKMMMTTKDLKEQTRRTVERSRAVDELMDAQGGMMHNIRTHIG